MSKISYRISVGTGDETLSVNRVSRVYTLLTTKIRDGYKYGVQYRFFSAFPSRVEDFVLLGDETLKPGDSYPVPITAEMGTIDFGYILNKRDIAADNVVKRPVVMNNHKIAGNLKDSEVFVFPLQQIAQNPDSIADQLSTLIANSNRVNIGIHHTHIISENKDSIGNLLDKAYIAITSTPFKSIDIHTIKQSDILDNLAIIDGEILEFDRGLDNILEKLKGHKLYDRASTESSKLNDSITAGYEWDETVILDTVVTAGWNDDTANIYHVIEFAERNETLSEFFDKLMTAYSKIDGIPKEALINDTMEAGVRYNKPALFNTISKTGIRRNKPSRMVERLRNLLRVGRPVSMKVENIKRAVKGNRSATVFNTLHIMSKRFDRPSRVIKNIKLVQKLSRNGRTINKYVLANRDKYNSLINRDGFIYTDRGSKDARNNNESIIGSDRIEDQALIEDKMMMFDNIMRNAFKEYRIKRAVNPTRPVFRLFNIFQARMLNKVVFADRAKHPFILVNRFDKGETSNKEAIIVINIDKHAEIKESAAELQSRIDLAVSKECESIIVVGVIQSENKEAECDVLVTKISDKSKAGDCIVDLQAVGYGKAEHLTDTNCILIEGENKEVSEAIMSVLELAIDVNKKRQAQGTEIMDIAKRINDNEQLARMNNPFTTIADAKDIIQGRIEKPLVDADWDTEWEQLCRIYLGDTKDRTDPLKVPNDDFDYAKFAEGLYNPTTGVPKSPIGLTNLPDVEVSFPNVHYSPKYADNLERQPVPVDLYVYKDMMLLIWIFWCKHRTSERVRDILEKFYKDENLDMKILQEYSKIVQFDAAKAINYVLDNVYTWIQDTIAYFDTEKMNQYERVMKQVRWFGEKIAFEMSKFILHRTYDSEELYNGNAITDLTVNQPIDGELVIEAFVDADSSIRIFIDGESKVTCNTGGIYRVDNPTQSPFILPALKTELKSGNRKVTIQVTGNVIIYSCKRTNALFKSAEVTYTSQSGCGTLAIDKLLRMMYDYYEKHHTNKAKGVRDMWMLG